MRLILLFFICIFLLTPSVSYAMQKEQQLPVFAAVSSPSTPLKFPRYTNSRHATASTSENQALSGIIHLGNVENWFFATETHAINHFSQNAIVQDQPQYTYDVSLWAATPLANNTIFSFGILGEVWTGKHTAHQYANRTLFSAEERTGFKSGKSLGANFGLDLSELSKQMGLYGDSLAVEAGVPLYEDVQGAETPDANYHILLGWKMAF